MKTKTTWITYRYYIDTHTHVCGVYLGGLMANRLRLKKREY